MNDERPTVADLTPQETRRKKLVLHIEVPGIYVDDVTPEALADCGADIDDPEHVADYLTTDALRADGTLTLAHDDVGGYSLSAHDCRIIGARVVDRDV